MVGPTDQGIAMAVTREEVVELAQMKRAGQGIAGSNFIGEWSLVFDHRGEVHGVGFFVEPEEESPFFGAVDDGVSALDGDEADGLDAMKGRAM